MTRRLLFLPIVLAYALPLAAQSNDWLADFASALKPSSPPAVAIETLDPDNDRSEVIDSLAGWFRAKPAPDPLWVIPFPSEPLEPSLLERADKAVNHLIIDYIGSEQYGNELPWFDPDKHLTTLSRFPHLDALAPAYFWTGDEKYAGAMVRDMLDFIEHVPVSAADQYHVQVDPRVNPWNWVLLQWRVKRWIDALAYLRGSPSISDESYLRVIWHIWQEVDWLVPHKMLGLHNGTLGNLSAILYASIAFPEAASADNWYHESAHFFNAFLDTAFYPGEFLVELTLGYSEGTLLASLLMFESLPETPLKQQIGEKLEQLVEAHVGMMKPDRSLPRYGDHGAYDIRERILLRSARLFDRPDFYRLARDPADPDALGDRLSFPWRSNPYYLSGYYAMRDGWDSQALYLSMDAGPFGTNHHHADKLSITVSADGVDFIVDPGTSVYKSTEPGPRIDLRPGYHHNVITIDDVDPNTGWDRHYGFDVLENRWVTNEYYDFLEGTYEFRNNLIDVIWRRSVLFLKGDYWVMVDALLGDGRHKIESNFQFSVGSELNVGDEGRIEATTGGGSLLQMHDTKGLVPTVTIGDTLPHPTTFLLQYPTFVDWTRGGRGWVGSFGNETSMDPVKSHPAPALVFSGDVELPHHSIHVLLPESEDSDTNVAVDWVENSTDRLVFTITRSGRSTDHFVWTTAGRTSPDVALPDDHLAVIRTHRVDGGVELILSNQTSFQTEGEPKLEVSFSEAFEGRLVDTGEGWVVYPDLYLTGPVMLEELSVTRNGTHSFLRSPVELLPGVPNTIVLNH